MLPFSPWFTPAPHTDETRWDARDRVAMAPASKRKTAKEDAPERWTRSRGKRWSSSNLRTAPPPWASSSKAA
eukprot:jgi/Pico_ML_1/50549/g1737.t1